MASARLGLAGRRARLYPGDMTRVFDMDDRARLSERFYEEARSVLARA